MKSSYTLKIPLRSHLDRKGEIFVEMACLLIQRSLIPQAPFEMTGEAFISILFLSHVNQRAKTGTNLIHN